jgi:hypothetical protein
MSYMFSHRVELFQTINLKLIVGRLLAVQEWRIIGELMNLR